jgi:TATA-box binding protein (TBP) (component of TFIID and TFIIIB)
MKRHGEIFNAYYLEKQPIWKIYTLYNSNCRIFQKGKTVINKSKSKESTWWEIRKISQKLMRTKEKINKNNIWRTLISQKINIHNFYLFYSSILQIQMALLAKSPYIRNNVNSTPAVR